MWNARTSAVFALALTLGLLTGAPESAAGDGPSYSAGRFAMTLDGSFSGYIKKLSAGGTELGHELAPATSTNMAKKHLATISHEPLTIEIAGGVGRPMWDWIKASWDQGLAPKDVVVSGQGTTSIVALGAYVQSVTFPGIDVRLQRPFTLQLELGHQGLDARPSVAPAQPLERAPVAPPRASGVRLEIDGLPCNVVKLDTFTWRAPPAELHTQWPTRESARPNPTRLAVTLEPGDRDAFDAWYGEARKRGQQRTKKARGALSVLGPDPERALMTISLQNVGILALEPEAAPASKTDGLARFKVELYVEEMRFDALGG